MKNSQNTSSNFNKVIVIAGPTGSGKTGVAIEIAREIGGEIISADSRAIYKYMDIATAKPTLEERAGIPHFGLDLVEPGERFTVADWKEYAEGKIAEIRSRGHVPMVVGGTGLYIDAFIFDYKFGVTDYSDREKMSSEFVVFGIKTEKDELRRRLTERVNKLFVQELFDETEWLVKKYGWESQAMKSNFYQFVWQYLRGEISLERAKELAVLDDWHLAKRQMTWFKRNLQIVWLPLEKMKSAVLKCIQDE